jgi:EF-P beta-lysylation protein EpmB
MHTRAPLKPIEPGDLRWQEVLSGAVRDLEELLALVELKRDAVPAAADPGDFPLLVPRGYIARIRKGDPRDPLLLQVLPRKQEQAVVPGFGSDPVRETRLADGGLIRKYPGRALVVTTAACPVHCRYCFRREFPYAEQIAARDEWSRALCGIESDRSIREVILSGGDPLSMSNRRLGRLLDSIAAIDHVRTVRIHTRFPIMIPERIDSPLVALLEASRCNIVVVIHANHANEIDSFVESSLTRLGRSTAALLNQSVLLRSINDDVGILAALSERLIGCGVLPYYLHLLDPVAGAAHFDVAADEARRLVEALRARLPGYLVPRLVREVPGELSKTPIH